MKIYKHWSDYPMSKWRWPDFTPQEVASKGEGELAVNEDAMDKLQALRHLVGPLYLTSAYRSKAHNRRVGGAKQSKHLEARAFDVKQHNLDTVEFEKAARSVGFLGFGFYPKQNFIHIDTGPAREWGERWIADNRPPDTIPDAPPAVEVPGQGIFAAIMAFILSLFGGSK